ncbi:hypothetical protein IMSHALPRED_005680 [Imshaugia aleurites]|uniref:Uncharacterized protein n=1 Tax=Imshaugia aleurites TaxID=172621 RepID=A0A8H3FF88_9LECA|nr:hypothetical protein IMSHALPRED_005680 [Imshaugia aleurites]
MAAEIDEGSKNEPETWYKVVMKSGAAENVESSSRSEDDLNMSPGTDNQAKPEIYISNSWPEEDMLEIPRSNAPLIAAPPRSKPNPPVKLTDSETLQALEKHCRDLQKAYDEAHRDLQHSTRENRDQSLELRDQKRRLTKIQEQNAQLREQNGLLREACQAYQARGEKLSKSERNKYNENFEMLENHISNLQHERHKRETHMESLTEQTREANDGKDRLEGEVRKLQRQMRDLSANLTECKDDLLRLQPTSQVSDNEVSEQFSNLDQQIAGWIDDRTEDPTAMEENIGSIKTVDDLPELLRMFATPDHLRLAKKHPDSQPLLLRYFIHCYLQTFILSSDVYLFGLDSRNIALLQGMEEGMKQLEPRRGSPSPFTTMTCSTTNMEADEKTVRNWRSETLRGLLKMDNFIEEQNRQAKIASQTLSEALSALISDTANDASSPDSLHAQIIQPTVHLATQLRLSTTTYRLFFHPFTRDAKKRSTAHHHEIPNSSMIDMATHKMIRPDSVLKIGADGRIGEEMLVVSPALVREQEDGKGKVMVCKPTVLVKLDEPMGKRGRGIRALGAWTPSWLGGEEGGE